MVQCSGINLEGVTFPPTEEWLWQPLSTGATLSRFFLLLPDFAASFLSTTARK